MQISSMQKQNFGAIPDAVFNNYVGKTLTQASSANHAKILDKYTEIRKIFDSKTLTMLTDNTRLAVIKLDDKYLTNINKSESVLENLSKIVDAMKGRKLYLDYFELQKK